MSGRRTFPGCDHQRELIAIAGVGEEQQRVEWHENILLVPAAPPYRRLTTSRTNLR
jgi:hypothetical protein